MSRSNHFNDGVSAARPDSGQNWLRFRAFGANPMNSIGKIAGIYPGSEHQFLSEDTEHLPKPERYDRGR